MENLKAILFDVDGVLLDSREALYHVYSDGLKRFGLPQKPREQVLALSGMTDYEWIRKLAPDADEDVVQKAADWCAHSYATIYLSRFATPMPGSVDALGILRKKFKLAVVTNQSRPQAKKSLEILGFSDFDAVVSMDDVEKPKPGGEPLEKVLTELNVPCDHAVYVGDTITDVLAGKAAGVSTWILDASYNRDLPGIHVKNFNELVNRLHG